MAVEQIAQFIERLVKYAATIAQHVVGFLKAAFQPSDALRFVNDFQLFNSGASNMERLPQMSSPHIQFSVELILEYWPGSLTTRDGGKAVTSTGQDS